MFSFQFTLARVRIYSVQFHILMMALMDFEAKKHYYAQNPIFFSKNVTITSEKVGLGEKTQMRFSGFELLADVKDKSGESIGYCVVELLPGVYNETNPLAAFVRVKS